MAEGHKLEAQMLEAGAREFMARFKNEHGLEIIFDDSAIRRLVERAQAERMTMSDLVRPFVQGLSIRVEPDQKEHGSRNSFFLTPKRSTLRTNSSANLSCNHITRCNRAKGLIAHEAFGDYNADHWSRSSLIVCRSAACHYSS